MSVWDINWQQLAAAVGLILLVMSAGFVVLQARLSDRFVTHEIFQPVTTRVGALEQSQGSAPTRRDVGELEGRVERLEDQVSEVQRTATEIRVGVGSLTAGQEGLRREVGGIGHQIDLLTKHLLEKNA